MHHCHKKWIIRSKLVSTMTCLFIVMADSTWLLQDIWLIYFLFLPSRCVQVFVTLKLIIIAMNTSLLNYIPNIIVCDDYKSWPVLNPLLIIGSKGRYLIHWFINRFFVGFCCCELCYLNSFLTTAFKHLGDFRGMLQESDDPLHPPEPPEPPGSEPDQEHLRLLNAQTNLIFSPVKKYKCHSCEEPDCTVTAPCTAALEVR